MWPIEWHHCQCPWMTLKITFAVWNLSSNIAKFFGEFSCIEYTGQRNDFKLIPTVAMETRNHVEGYFSIGFPVIYNHCGVMEASKSRNVKHFGQTFAFLGKSTSYGKIIKILFWHFHSDTDRRVVFTFREIWLTGNRWNRALFTWQEKKISPGSPAVATAWIAPKICQNQPPIMYSKCSRFHPNRFSFGRVMVERVNTDKTRRKVNPIFGWSLSSSRIISGTVV